MAAYLSSLCIYVNETYWPHFSENILLYFANDNEVRKAYLPCNKRLLHSIAIMKAVYNHIEIAFHGCLRSVIRLCQCHTDMAVRIHTVMTTLMGLVKNVRALHLACSAITKFVKSN